MHINARVTIDNYLEGIFPELAIETDTINDPDEIPTGWVLTHGDEIATGTTVTELIDWLLARYPDDLPPTPITLDLRDTLADELVGRAAWEARSFPDNHHQEWHIITRIGQIKPGRQTNYTIWTDRRVIYTMPGATINERIDLNTTGLTLITLNDNGQAINLTPWQATN